MSRALFIFKDPAGSLICFTTFELKSVPAALIVSMTLSCVCVYTLWKSPAAAFVMLEATKFTASLSSNRCLLIVCFLVKL